MIKTIMTTAAATCLMLATGPGFVGVTPAAAGPITRACLGSASGVPDTRLCGCIQQVANMTLTARDQRTAARFFAEPQRAQDMRTSKRSQDNVFWKRYRQFGDTAAASCS